MKKPNHEIKTPELNLEKRKEPPSPKKKNEGRKRRKRHEIATVIIKVAGGKQGRR